jgi:hypothetical protein
MGISLSEPNFSGHGRATLIPQKLPKIAEDARK